MNNYWWLQSTLFLRQEKRSNWKFWLLLQEIEFLEWSCIKNAFCFQYDCRKRFLASDSVVRAVGYQSRLTLSGVRRGEEGKWRNKTQKATTSSYWGDETMRWYLWRFLLCEAHTVIIKFIFLLKWSPVGKPLRYTLSRWNNVALQRGNKKRHNAFKETTANSAILGMQLRIILRALQFWLKWKENDINTSRLCRSLIDFL